MYIFNFTSLKSFCTCQAYINLYYPLEHSVTTDFRYHFQTHKQKLMIETQLLLPTQNAALCICLMAWCRNWLFMPVWRRGSSAWSCRSKRNFRMFSNDVVRHLQIRSKDFSVCRRDIFCLFMRLQKKFYECFLTTLLDTFKPEIKIFLGLVPRVAYPVIHALISQKLPILALPNY